MCWYEVYVNNVKQRVRYNQLDYEAQLRTVGYFIEDRSRPCKCNKLVAFRK